MSGIAKKGSRSLLRRLKGLLAVRETPARVAGTFAAGFGCGTMPLFAGAVVLPFLIRFLRLNKLIAIGVTTLILANPALGFIIPLQTWLGLSMMGEPVPAWILKMEVSGLWRHLGSSGKILAAYLVGGFGSALLLGALSFFILWPALEWRALRPSALRRRA